MIVRSPTPTKSFTRSTHAARAKADFANPGDLGSRQRSRSLRVEGDREFGIPRRRSCAAATRSWCWIAHCVRSSGCPPLGRRWRWPWPATPCWLPASSRPTSRAFAGTADRLEPAGTAAIEGVRAIRAITFGPGGWVYLIEEQRGRLIALELDASVRDRLVFGRRRDVAVGNGPIRMARVRDHLIIDCLLDHALVIQRLDASGTARRRAADSHRSRRTDLVVRRQRAAAAALSGSRSAPPKITRSIERSARSATSIPFCTSTMSISTRGARRARRPSTSASAAWSCPRCCCSRSHRARGRLRKRQAARAEARRHSRSAIARRRDHHRARSRHQRRRRALGWRAGLRGSAARCVGRG